MRLWVQFPSMTNNNDKKLNFKREKNSEGGEVERGERKGEGEEGGKERCGVNF